MSNSVNPYNRSTNHLVSVDAAGGYEARGVVTKLGAVAMGYDAEGNMKSTVDSGTGQSITWIYDAEGQRAQKWVSGGATVVYVHDALGQLAAEYNSSVGVTPACTTCYLTDDMIGTVRLITDQNQNVVARHDYTPYGVEIPNGTAGRNGNFGYNSNVTQGFTGQEADGGTASLHYFNARHMSGVLGGFVQPDPANAGASVGNPQTWNAYGYVSGNPLGLGDPSGMCELDPNCNVAVLHEEKSCRWWQFWCWGGSFSSGGTPEDFDTSGQADLSGYDSSRVTATSPGSSGGGGGSSAPTGSASTASTLPPKTVIKIGNFPTLDCDGYRAAKSVLPQTAKRGIEFGGFLYKNGNGRYSYSNPVAGNPTSIPTLFSSPQALVSGIVGWFHDHPLVPGYNNDMFSGADLLDTRKTGPGYLGTASGRILKLAIDSQGLPHVTDVNSGACQVP